MEYRKLGTSNLKISSISLGSMTWGEQNDEAEAFRQLDFAVDAGINCIDTAELYPVPPRAETYGRSEQIIGNWLQRRNRRDQVILASKIVGPGDWVNYVRDGMVGLDRRNIIAAVDASLQRLRTDYIDLYQVHWPSRDANYFGQLNYYHAPEKDGVAIGETLAVLSDLVSAGKIRYIGVCNETAWGVSRWLQCAEAERLPRIVSIQNPFNLLNRSFEIGLSEFSHREQVGLLAYSPLGFGVLSGKYVAGTKPVAGRLTLFGSRYRRYVTERGIEATRLYVETATAHGLRPAQMALAFVLSRPFVCSVIIGATNMQQLTENIDSANVTLSKTLKRELDSIHSRFPNPCP